MEYSLLRDLNGGKEDWATRIRVCRMWESTNTKKNDEVISMDMIFIDEEENLIHAVIRKHLISRFKHLLIEGALYSVKNLRVVASTGVYRPLSNDLKILYLAKTSLKRLEEGDVEIPLNGFQFIDPNMIDARVNDNTILSDVVGCLSGVGEVDVVGGGWKKRDIKITTNYSVSSKITLWGKLGELFGPDLYKKDGGPYIVVVTSVAVRRFQGEISFTTTNASKLYINLDTPYVTSLRARFMPLAKTVEVIGNSSGKKFQLEEEMFVNRMSVKELVESDWSCDLKEFVATIRGKIIGIDDTFGWYYVSCKVCLKKVVTTDGVFMCKACETKIEYPLVLFKVHVKVMDETGVTTCVLFNMVAERLLDMSAKKLFNVVPPSKGGVPQEIQALVGKELVFKLKLNHYNLSDGYENFTVAAVFEPNEGLEEAHESKTKALNNKDGDVECEDVAAHGRKRKKCVVVSDDEADRVGE